MPPLSDTCAAPRAPPTPTSSSPPETLTLPPIEFAALRLSNPPERLMLVVTVNGAETDCVTVAKIELIPSEWIVYAVSIVEVNPASAALATNTSSLVGGPEGVQFELTLQEPFAALFQLILVMTSPQGSFTDQRIARPKTIYDIHRSYRPKRPSPDVRQSTRRLANHQDPPDVIRCPASAAMFEMIPPDIASDGRDTRHFESRND